MLSLYSTECVIQCIPFSGNIYSDEISSHVKGTVTDAQKNPPLIISLNKQNNPRRELECGEREWAQHEVCRLIRVKICKEIVDRGGVAESRSQRWGMPSND